MELSGILTFFGVFIAILCVLIGIAYYGIRDVNYEDTLKAKTSEQTKKKQKTKQKRDESNKSAKKSLTVTNKKQNEQEQQQSSEEEEEEPIVLIPDPFTNQLSSRFAGAGTNLNKKVEPVQESKKSEVIHNKPVVSLPQEEKQTTELQKVKPKATVKPNQAVTLVEEVKQQQQQAPVTIVKPILDESLNLKLKDLELALNERTKTVEVLNKTNSDLKMELGKLQAVNGKTQKDLDTQKQTNHVIQQELIKMTTRLAGLEKEKNSMEEKFRKELNALKSQEEMLMEKLNFVNSQSASLDNSTEVFKAFFLRNN